MARTVIQKRLGNPDLGSLAIEHYIDLFLETPRCHCRPSSLWTLTCLRFAATNARYGVMALAHSQPNVQNPELAEALAVRDAISFIQEEGLHQVVIATDCLSVVQRCRSSSLDRSGCAPVIEDIKSLLRDLSFVTLIHVRRNQNTAAHCLAN